MLTIGFVPGPPRMPEDRRPAFARDFPRVPELDALVDAFVRGDYARVRTEGPKVAAGEHAQDVRVAAQTLVARTAPDPLAIWLFVLAGALVLVLSGYWIVEGKPPPAGAPNVPRAPSSLGGSEDRGQLFSSQARSTRAMT
jgi:hypothetical protein